ncbi:MAG: InlB B-repeat-containing protein, partial [Desulfobacteraceae bacterium]|nr:InlB B-repeat-containing protein [Desulfobacteraceae bacterium]
AGISSVTMDAAKTVKVLFAEEGVTPDTHPLTVLVSPGGHIRSEYGEGMECDSECMWDIPAGETVILRAVPDEGYIFDGWQEDFTGNTSIATVTMDGPKTLKAQFGDGGVTPQTLPLTVLVSPGGHVRSEYGTGLECYSECVWDIKAGETVAIRAVPDDGHRFDGWQGDLTGNVSIATVTMDGPKNVKAVFAEGGVTPEMRILTVSVFPEGAGYVDSPQAENLSCDSTECRWPFSEGEEVSLTAHSNQEYRFERWEGDIEGTKTDPWLTMDSSKTVIAVFVKIEQPQVLTLSVTPAEAGYVDSPQADNVSCSTDKCNWSFLQDENIELRAYANQEYRFERWEGDIEETESPAWLIMDSPKTVKAVFTRIEQPKVLTVSVSPAGSGYVDSPQAENLSCETEDCKWTFNAGEEVELTAHSKQNFRFERWEGDIEDTAESIWVIMDSAKTVRAVFAEIDEPQILTLSVSPAGAGYVNSPQAGNVSCKSGDCKWSFDTGEEVELAAYSNQGFLFEGWKGDIEDTESSLWIIMDSPITLEALFTEIPESQVLTLSVSPPGAGYINSPQYDNLSCKAGGCEWHFTADAKVTLTAHSDSDYQFDHWEGDLGGSYESPTITMNDEKTVTAVFTKIKRPKTLTVSVSPPGAGNVYSDPEGLSCSSSNCTRDFPKGSEVTLYARSDSGYEFIRWEGDLTGPDDSPTIEMSTDKTVTAVFEPVQKPQTLKVSVSPPGKGTVKSWPEGIKCQSSDCSVVFEHGEEVTLQAQGESGYQFDHWEGDLTDQSNFLLFDMDSDKSVTAVFTAVQDTKILTVSVEGGGYVDSWPQGVNCPDEKCEWKYPLDEEVTLYANSKSGYQFDYWEGDMGSYDSLSVVMDSDKQVTAVFSEIQIPKTLEISVIPWDGGYVSSCPEGIDCPDGNCKWNFANDKTVTLSAHPYSGYELYCWVEGLIDVDYDESFSMGWLENLVVVSSDESFSINMGSDKEITAVFWQSDIESVEPGADALTMISLTYELYNPSSLSVFPEINEDNYGKDYRIGTYDATIGTYHEYGPSLVLEPGRGCWVLARDGIDITVQGTPVSLIKDFDLKLLYNSETGDGWNMVACPNEKTYNWMSDIMVFQKDSSGIKGPMSVKSSSNDLVGKILWKWKDGTYCYFDPDDSYENEQYEPDYEANPFLMTPGEGYWVKAKKENVYLRFPGKTSRSGTKTLRRIKETRSGEATVTDSSDSPPAPVGGFSSGNSSKVEDSVGGCFIDTAAGTRQKRSFLQFFGIHPKQ